MEEERTVYETENGTVEVERVFTGKKSIRELILALLLKRHEDIFPRP